MNPRQKHNAAPNEIFASVWRNRQLVSHLAKREVIGRYRGSIMGLAWSFLNPILMLAVYTVFFTVAFKARWGVSSEQCHADFAIVLFVGLIVHSFAECLNRSPGLISGMVIEIIREPIRGVRGILLRKEKRHRLVLGVRLIQQAAVVEIDATDCQVNLIATRVCLCNGFPACELQS